MHPAFSVIFLTTLIGAGQGLFLALYTGELYSAVRVLPSQPGADFYGSGSLLALALLVAGLVASLFHLGRPERGWRAAARWRTSWLSREVIVLPAFMAMVFVYGLIHFTGWDPVFFHIGRQADIAIDLSILVGAVASVLAFALFVCTGMIYAAIKFLQEWATPLTVINYLLLGSASGFTLATAYAAFCEPALTAFYGAWAIILTLAALVSRSAALLRNRRLRHKSTLQTAIGIRHTQIVQKAQGSMGGSFNTREYNHGRSPSFLTSMMWISLLMAFGVPLLLLAIGLTPPAPLVLTFAFLFQYLGLLAERWLFFAQARHPQNLYYQTV
ncbi:dimethyl sulfoxide reductase anchor subunit [Thiohalobacter sp. IOR34]|uniref:dimethyl sulfoxide reductase anchor subunit family protein n=1 Tax=Thiohalobacter sp. IOR34 TaxID=3057176 RepID=UPI0025B11E00|nr:DmsC/YnfH family molybdoenzyme membrane anchor subunit [Thiohalobacter sp. IOR34]WJW75351.1 dimethyl sulfoxide reductase anchor subunit [Thiohalobacter sp. IOR34]